MPSDISAACTDQSVEELRRELAEARAQQAATSDILRVISSSPTELQRVFAEIATSAARLCNAYDAVIRRVDGNLLRRVAHYGAIPQDETLPLKRQLVTGRAILEARTIQVTDVQAEGGEYPEGSDRARLLGHRTILAVPLFLAGAAIGAIVIRRTEARPFTDRQVELLKIFADQAVIAIENSRLFEAEQARARELTKRTQELTETLEYQTATSEILRVISSSPTDVQPTFDAIAKSARRLCEAAHGMVFRFDGELIHLVAHDNLDSGQLSAVRSVFPIPPGRGSITARAVLTRTLVHVQDRSQDPELDYIILSANFPTTLSVPLLRDGVALGAITVTRAEVALFSDRQVELLKTFADQAVIAIENTRLFEAEQARTRELSEALEQQTATADILGVISRSPTALQPVLDTLVKSATRFCGADDVTIFRLQGDDLVFVAHYGPLGFPPSLTGKPSVGQSELPNQQGLIVPVVRGTTTGRSLIERRAIHIADLQTETEEFPEGSAFARKFDYRAILSAPLLRHGSPLGAIVLRRREAKLFTDKQVELVTTFADQAVIAIENTRLFEVVQARTRELQESLDYQTATSDVLEVISRTPIDLQPVLAAICQTVAKLCETKDAEIFIREGDRLRLGWVQGPIGTEAENWLITPGLVMGRAVLNRELIQVPDLRVAGEEYPEGYQSSLLVGHRTIIAVPLMRKGEAVGVLTLRRPEVKPFTDKQIALLRTFADQAVIAIENTRLFEEVQERTRELAKTVEDLEIASQHKSQFVANMSHELRTPLAAILGYAELMQEGFYEPLGQKSLDALTRIRSNGKHLLGLINTVLDIAKIESGQFTLNISEYAIESVVETVRSATESLAQNKKLALKTEVIKPLPVGLGDEQRLTQVLLNLVGNAIKFTDTGEVHVTATAADGHFNVRVTDTGPGIPEEHHTRIFEQFHQVDSSNTKAKGGTGLGLAIAKQIVEMHGGRIWVESTLGKGSTFQMQLPMRAELR
jgi:signal transduction histidine kinase